MLQDAIRASYGLQLVAGNMVITYVAIDLGKSGYATISPSMDDRLPVSVDMGLAFKVIQRMMSPRRHDQQWLLLYYLGRDTYSA